MAQNLSRDAEREPRRGGGREPRGDGGREPRGDGGRDPLGGGGREPRRDGGTRRGPSGDGGTDPNQGLQRWTATNSAGYAAPAALAVDVVVLTVRDGRLQVLTVARPEGGRALPGGLVGETEAPRETAARKLREKTGLTDLYLEQLATFAEPARDPRGWIPSVAYLALVPADTEPTDPAARWDPVDEHDSLAFDHEEILGAALDRVRGKLWWSNIAVGILPGPFTMAQAREVYQAVAGTTYDPSTFARDLRATGLIRPAGRDRLPTGGRPAAVYAFGSREPAWGAGRRKRVNG